jgi:hypothetical protein
MENSKQLPNKIFFKKNVPVDLNTIFEIKNADEINLKNKHLIESITPNMLTPSYLQLKNNDEIKNITREILESFNFKINLNDETIKEVYEKALIFKDRYYLEAKNLIIFYNFDMEKIAIWYFDGKEEMMKVYDILQKKLRIGMEEIIL